MSSFMRLGASDGTLSSNGTTNINEAPHGAAQKLYCIANVIVATGAWSITLRKRIAGSVITIASLGGIAAPGLFVLTLDAAFNGRDANTPNHAIPLPDQIVFTRTAGDHASEVYLAIA